MNSDIRVSTKFLVHPKTVSITQLLGDGAIKWILALWVWAAENRPNGNLAGMKSAIIDVIAGASPGFAEAMRDVGFIDGEEGDYSLHDWEEHQPWACDAENREDKSRFSRLAKSDKSLFIFLKDHGISSLTKTEFQELKRQGFRSDSVVVQKILDKRCTFVVRTVHGPYTNRTTNVQRTNNERTTNEQRNAYDSCSPAPTPTPIVNNIIHTPVENFLDSQTEAEIDRVTVETSEAVRSKFKAWARAVNREAERPGSEMKPVHADQIGPLFCQLHAASPTDRDKEQHLDAATVVPWRKLNCNHSKSHGKPPARSPPPGPQNDYSDLWAGLRQHQGAVKQ